MYKNVGKAIAIGIVGYVVAIGLPAAMKMEENLQYSIFLILCYMCSVISYLLLSKKK